MPCATDGHARNFSLFLWQGGRYQLTPFYDVLSAWPGMGGHQVPGMCFEGWTQVSMSSPGRLGAIHQLAH